MGEQLRREQLQPEGEVEHPGMLSPGVCFSLDAALQPTARERERRPRGPDRGGLPPTSQPSRQSRRHSFSHVSKPHDGSLRRARTAAAGSFAMQLRSFRGALSQELGLDLPGLRVQQLCSTCGHDGCRRVLDVLVLPMAIMGERQPAQLWPWGTPIPPECAVLIAACRDTRARNVSKGSPPDRSCGQRRRTLDTQLGC